jgi:hypothetical protein
MLETQAVGVRTDCGKPLYLRLSRVSPARTDAQVPQFRDGPFGQALKSAKIWSAHPDRPVSCEEIKTPQCGVFFALTNRAQHPQSNRWLHKGGPSEMIAA